MANCSRCGTSLGEYGHGGLCTSCSTLADADNVQCQRCGMYLPSHELKMLNSRLYCAYCTMDVQDEIEHQRKIAEHPVQPSQEKMPEKAHAPPANPPHDSSSPLGGMAVSAPSAPVSQGEPLSQQLQNESGICERCGANSDRLYLFKRRKMCAKCTKEEGGSIEPASSFFHKLHEIVAKFLLFKKKN